MTKATSKLILYVLVCGLCIAQILALSYTTTRNVQLQRQIDSLAECNEANTEMIIGIINYLKANKPQSKMEI